MRVIVFLKNIQSNAFGWNVQIMKNCFISYATPCRFRKKKQMDVQGDGKNRKEAKVLFYNHLFLLIQYHRH